MKPTKMRNKQIYQATNAYRSAGVSSHMSKNLQEKYSKKSVRVCSGDTVKVIRGEYKGIEGKVVEVVITTGRVTIDGIKREKTRGDKFDVHIHSSNVIVTDLNGDDQWRIKKLRGETMTKKSKPEPANVSDEAEHKETQTEETTKDSGTDDIAQEADEDIKNDTKADDIKNDTKPEAKTDDIKNDTKPEAKTDDIKNDTKPDTDDSCDVGGDAATPDEPKGDTIKEPKQTKGEDRAD